MNMMNRKIIENFSFQEYQAYLDSLEEKGFRKYVDNGSDGLEGCVWNSVYTKDHLVVTVIYIDKTHKCYITEMKDLPLSEHFIHRENSLDKVSQNAKTRLHMPELHSMGNSFIIQLKNGHFILDDGGMRADALYLLDYLEQLVSGGEKPVVDAWFLSHGHIDHVGVLLDFGSHPEYAERIIVEGVYFCEPDEEVCERWNMTEVIQKVKLGIQNCKTSRSEQTPIYRPQTGQRYYFQEVTVDVLHTQEQLPLEAYENGFNESSTWLLYTIEGQRFLHGGDAGKGAVVAVIDNYGPECLDFDIMATFHHGQNIFNTYLNAVRYKTVLYTTFVSGSQTANYKEAENKRLQERAEEYMSWGDGTKILTFPYQVGTAQSLPPRKWIYHPDREIPKLHKNG